MICHRRRDARSHQSLRPSAPPGDARLDEHLVGRARADHHHLRGGCTPTNSAERALRRAALWHRRSFGTGYPRAGSRFVERVLTAMASLGVGIGRARMASDVEDEMRHAWRCRLR